MSSSPCAVTAKPPSRGEAWTAALAHVHPEVPSEHADPEHGAPDARWRRRTRRAVRQGTAPTTTRRWTGATSPRIVPQDPTACCALSAGQPRLRVGERVVSSGEHASTRGISMSAGSARREQPACDPRRGYRRTQLGRIRDEDAPRLLTGIRHCPRSRRRCRGRASPHGMPVSTSSTRVGRDGDAVAVRGLACERPSSVDLDAVIAR
jgi:hypothetical protein